MEELDKTARLISIQLLENILSDTNTFFSFISFDKNRDLFPYSLDEYITALNNYIQYMIKKNDNISSTEIERINTINKFFKANYPIYNKNIDLNETQNLVPISLIKDLLTNEETLNKFLNFNQNRNLFPLEYFHYTEAVMNYMDVMQKYHVSFPHSYRNHLDKILEFSKVLSNGYTISSKNIDTELEEKLFQNIPKEYSGLPLARAIYVELAKLIQYDDVFLVTSDDNQKQQIYNQEINTITLNNNKVTCKSWAELYCAILNKHGIQAVVNENEYHKKVLINIDGNLITADSTNSFIDDQDSMRLCDITRIKLGLNTAGFTSNDPNFENTIKTIDQNLNEHNKQNDEQFNSMVQQYNNSITIEKRNRIKQLQDNLYQTIGNETPIHKKLQQATQNILSKNLDTTSSISYINQFLKTNLTPEERLYCTSHIIKIKTDDNNYHLNILIENTENIESVYYLYTEGVGLQKVDNALIDNLIQNEQIKSFNEKYELNTRRGMIA